MEPDKNLGINKIPIAWLIFIREPWLLNMGVSQVHLSHIRYSLEISQVYYRLILEISHEYVNYITAMTKDYLQYIGISFI